jgi:hypothetical protein
LPDRPTRIEVVLLCARRRGPLGRPVAAWRRSPRWFDRRLRIAQIIADDTVIADFRQHPPFVRF